MPKMTKKKKITGTELNKNKLKKKKKYSKTIIDKQKINEVFF